MNNLSKYIIPISIVISVTNSQCGTNWSEDACLNDLNNDCEWIVRYGAEAPECLDLEIDECYCDTSNGLPQDPNTGHYGSCDCDKSYGLLEFRLRYINSIPATHIDIYYDGAPNSDIICSYDNVYPNQEIECNVRDFIDPATGVFAYEKFRTNTEFIITREDNSICQGEYHTSCSSDIVGGAPTAGCDTDFICTGWMDGGPTPECTNGEVPCDCREAPPEPTLPDITECYCQDPTMTGTNPNSGGAGWGDCECSGGMIELRWKYLGLDVANIKVYDSSDNGGDIVCQFNDVVPQEEIVCNIWDILDSNGQPVYDKFAKNTFFEVEHPYGTAGICSGVYHTSCSRDIVGYYATNDECTELICTGWKDGDTNHIDCDDGWVPCDCTTTNTPTTTIYNPCNDITEGELCDIEPGCAWNEGTGKCDIDSNYASTTTTTTGSQVETTESIDTTKVTDPVISTMQNGVTTTDNNIQISSTDSGNTFTTTTATTTENVCQDANDLKDVKFELKRKTGLTLKNADKYCQVCFCDDDNEQTCKDQVGNLDQKQKDKFMKGCELEGKCEFEYVGLVDGFQDKIQKDICDCTLFECKTVIQSLNYAHKIKVFMSMLVILVSVLYN